MVVKRRNKWIKIGAAIGALYIAGGVLLYLIQDLILFHPKVLPTDHRFHFTKPVVEKNIKRRDGSNLNLLELKKEHSKGIILFFHGNMENAEHYEKYVPFFNNLGYELWIMDYAGFGKSTGKRTEENMYNDAQTVYNLALKQTTPDSIIIYGKSIGTGVAAHLAAGNQCKQLILETPYYSIPALAKHYFPIYPVLPISRYLFPTFQYLSKVKAPVTLLHGTADEIIPYAQAKKLKEENYKVQLISIPKGKHNNLLSFPQFRAVIDSILR